MKMVKSLLLGSAAGFVAVAGAQAADLPVKAKPVEYVKVCPLYGAGFYYVPGTDTCLKLGAILRFQIENDASGGNVFANGVQALYTRTDTPNLNHRVRADLTWDSRTQTEYGTLRMYFRGGWEQTTPATPDETVHWDRGFIQFAGFTVGRSTSFFDFLSLAPYSYANNGRISSDMGATGQMVFGYTAQLGNGFSASIAIEDGGNSAAGPAGNNSRARGRSVLDLDAPVAGGIGNNVIAFANSTSTLTPDNGSSGIPDIVANIRVDQAWGSAQLSGAMHLNKAGYYSAFPPGGCIPGNSTRCDYPEDEIGWAVAGGILLNLPMIAPGDKFGVMAVYSEGAVGYSGRGATTLRAWHHGDSNGGLVSSYGVGFSGDSVFRNPGAVPGYGGQLELTRAFSAVAAFEHLWTRQLRTSLYGGVQVIEFNDTAKLLICPAGPGPFAVPPGFIPQGTSGLGVANCDPDHKVWAIGSRTQWNPHPYLDIGVDVLWANLDTAFAGLGVTTTAQGANPAQVVNIEDQDFLVVMGRVQYNFIP
jgi:Porin subfamily